MLLGEVEKQSSGNEVELIKWCGLNLNTDQTSEQTAEHLLSNQDE